MTTFFSVELDVTNPASVSAATKSISSQLDHLDTLTTQGCLLIFCRGEATADVLLLEAASHSHNRATHPVHCFLHVSLYYEPVRSPFGEFVHFFGSEDASVAVGIRNDYTDFLRALGVNQVDLGQLSQCAEVLRKRFVMHGDNIGIVMVRVTVIILALIYF